VIDGIFWVLRTGAPWRDLPALYGKVSTVASRFYRWRGAGVWAGLLGALQRLADAAGQLDWSLHFVDSTAVRAHQHAAGAKGGQLGQPLGRSRGGFSTELHVRAERGGRPVTFALTGGERQELVALPALLDGGAVKRPGPGRPACGRTESPATAATAAARRGMGCGATASAASSRSRGTSGRGRW
jgi:transposase